VSESLTRQPLEGGHDCHDAQAPTATLHPQGV